MRSFASGIVDAIAMQGRMVYGATHNKTPAEAGALVS